MTSTFLKIAEQVLDNVKKPLDVTEIWDTAKKLGLDKELNSTGKTPWRSIGAQIYVSIKDDEKNTPFYQTTKRPAKFFLKKYSNLVTEEEVENTLNSTEEKLKVLERDLHPLLVKFVNSDSHFKAHVRTIFHENSKRNKKGYNEWLHPDLVGVYFPFEKDLDSNAIDLQKTLSISSTKIFSFEMKINLNMGNMREYYFQAVSNSSWAHEGYLVALNIDREIEFRDELRRLSNSFGIGIIELNPENIDQSEILFPAKTNNTLDWETINRLIEANTDFKQFIQRITKAVNGRDVNKEAYDPVFNDEKFEKHLKEKILKK